MSSHDNDSNVKTVDAEEQEELIAYIDPPLSEEKVEERMRELMTEEDRELFDKNRGEAFDMNLWRQLNDKYYIKAENSLIKELFEELEQRPEKEGV